MFFFISSLIFILTPLVFSILVQNNFILVKTTIIFLGVVLLLNLNLFFKQKKYNLIIYCWEGFFLIQIFLLFFSADKYLSIFGDYYRRDGLLTQLFVFLAAYFLFISIDEKKEKIFLEAIWIVSSLVSLYAVLQYFNLDPYIWDSNDPRSFSSLGQPNNLATYLTMLIPLGIFLFLQEKNLFKSGLLFVILLINFLALVFTYSRAGWISFLISMVVLLVLTIKTNFKVYKILLLLLFFIVVFKVSMNLPNFKENNFTLKKRVLSLASSKDETKKERIYLWKGALFLIRDYYLLGSGWENIYYLFPKYKYKEINKGSSALGLPDKLHNEYLNYAASTGFIGLFSFLFFITVIIFQSLKNLFAKKINIFYFTSILAFLINIFFGFSTPATLLYFYGLVLLLNNNNFSKPVIIFNNKKLLIIISLIKNIILILASGGLLFLIIYHLKADYFLRKGKLYKLNKDILVFYYKAQKTFPYEYEYLKELTLTTSDLAYLENNNALLKKNIPNFKKLIKWRPLDTENYYNLGLTYEFLSKKEKKYLILALQNYQTAQNLFPNYPFYLVKCGDIYYKIFKITKDKNILKNSLIFYEKAYQIDDQLIYVLYKMGQNYYFLNEKNKAKEIFIKVEKNKFKDGDLYTWLGEIYAEENNLKQAEKNYFKALKLKTQFPAGIYNNLGNLYFGKKNYLKAKYYYELALKKYPKYLSAKNNLKKTSKYLNEKK